MTFRFPDLHFHTANAWDQNDHDNILSSNKTFPFIQSLLSIPEIFWLIYVLFLHRQLGALTSFNPRPTGIFFYNALHWGGGLFRAPPLISESTGPIVKIQAAFESPGKNRRRKTNFIDLGVTNDVTGQVKVKMFDFSGLVTSASKIAMLSSNKATNRHE